MSAKLTVRDDGDVVVIHAYGKLATGKGYHSIHSKLRELVEDGHARMLLNLSGVPSLDSADMGELLAGYAAVAISGGEMRLLNPRDSVEQVLRATGVSKLLGVYFDEVAAFRSFAGVPKLRDRPAARFETRSEWFIG